MVGRMPACELHVMEPALGDHARQSLAI